MTTTRLLGLFQKLSLTVLLSAILSACTGGSNNPDPAPTPSHSPTPVEITAGIPGLPRPFIPADNPTTQEGVLLGRMLFYDPRLSADGSISCASCHKLDKGMADDEVLSVGIRGQRTKRNSMALINLAWVNRFFWDGRSVSLEEQSLHPIQDPLEMANTLPNMVATIQRDAQYPQLFFRAFNTTTVTPELVGKALAQFERTLVSFNSKYDKYIRGELNLTQDELEGMVLFSTHPDPFSGARGLRGANCNDCHSVGLFQGRSIGFQAFLNNGIQPSIIDNGLSSVTGNSDDQGKMRIPTLRNIALTAPYMHNGTLPTLEAVMDHYNHPDLFQRPGVDLLIRGAVNTRFDSKLGLTPSEIQKVIAFLHTLTDTSFANNPAFKNPR